MKLPNLERVIRVAGAVLALAAGLSLLFCVVLVGSAVSKRYSVIQAVGYWPLFTLFLLLMSGLFLFGVPHLVRAIGKKKSDDKLG
jgi:hypothetical protein